MIHVPFPAPSRFECSLFTCIYPSPVILRQRVISMHRITLSTTEIHINDDCRIFLGMVDVDVALTYEKLYELLRREKGKDDLQQLDAAFFLQVVAYLRDKESSYSQNLLKTDVFSMNERQRLQTELHNIHRLVKELYERREKKILDMALNRSRTNANIIDTTNLLTEEKALFDHLVSNLDHFRVGVLQNLLTLKDPAVSTTVAQLRTFAEPVLPKAELPKTVVIEQPDFVPTPISSSQISLSVQKESVRAEQKSVNGKRVRFLQDAPQVVSSDMETYGPFSANDTATIPHEIAEIWIEQGACVEQLQ